MSVGIWIDCDGAGCAERHNAGERYAEFHTVETVGYEVEERQIWVEAEWFDLPEGWKVEQVGKSKRYPEGWRFECEGCSA